MSISKDLSKKLKLELEASLLIRHSVAIHLLLALLTAGFGNIFYALYVFNRRKKYVAMMMLDETFNRNRE